MTTRARITPGLILLVLCVAGCGQKGPLYLPGDPSQIRTPLPTEESVVVPVSQAPVADEDEENDEDDPR